MEHFHPDNIIPAVQQFVGSDFKKWCEKISLKEFWGIHDPVLGDIESPQMAAIRAGYLKFESLAWQLREYVEGEVEVRSEESREMLNNQLFSLKFQLDSISSETSINMLLRKINQNALKYYDGEQEDLIVEYSGEVVTRKVFSKKVPYAYDENYYVYQIYFRAATREVRLFLDGYYRDFNTHNINQDDKMELVKQTKEEISHIIKYTIQEELSKNTSANKKKKNVLHINSYMLYGKPEKVSERSKWAVVLHDKLFTHQFIALLTERRDESSRRFAEIFTSNIKVNRKIPWCKSNAALKKLIEYIGPYLNDDTNSHKYALSGLCFMKYGKPEYKYESENVRNPKSKISKNNEDILDDIFTSLPTLEKNPNIPPQLKK